MVGSRQQMLLLLVALIIAPTSFAQEFGYYVSRGRSVKDNEIDCQKLNNEGKKVSYCEQCGGLAYVSTMCTSNPSCKGFDMRDESCGYLKAKADASVQQRQAQFTSFCKAPRDAMSDRSRNVNSCSGEYVMWPGYDAAPNWDYDCNFKLEGITQTYCRVQGNHLALMDECNNDKDCDAFVVSVESNGQYGWLKKSNGKFSSMVKRDGYTYFAKNRR